MRALQITQPVIHVTILSVPYHHFKNGAYRPLGDAIHLNMASIFRWLVTSTSRTCPFSYSNPTVAYYRRLIRPVITDWPWLHSSSILYIKCTGVCILHLDFTQSHRISSLTCVRSVIFRQMPQPTRVSTQNLPRKLGFSAYSNRPPRLFFDHQWHFII